MGGEVGGCLLCDELANIAAWLAAGTSGAAGTASLHSMRPQTSQVCPLRWWSLPVRLTMQHSRRSSSLAAATVAFLLGVLVICVDTGQCSESGWNGVADGWVR
jgi:hypothetical protein